MKRLLSKYDIQNNRGVISVYLCLMFAIMISVLLVMIEATRLSAIKQTAECVTDMGTDSLLSEYHKELLSRYGLLFIDTAYEYDEGSLDNLTDHLISYMEFNLSPGKDLVMAGSYRDFTGLSISSVDMVNVSRATDGEGAVFRHMAISYMLDKYGLSLIDNAEDLACITDTYNLGEGDIISENKNAQAEIDDIEFPEIEGVNWDDVDTSNPSENAKKASSKGVLSLVYNKTLSGKYVNNDTLASHRDNVAGAGLISNWDSYDGIQYDLLFNEYILDKFSNLLDIKYDDALDYQVEYILFGSDTDVANLRKTADRLVMIRGASNAIYYATDSGLQAEVRAMAIGLAAVTLAPYLETVYELGLSAALIYAESLYDVAVLLDGGKIPLIKSKGDWNLTLSTALEKLAGTFTGSSSSNKGQDYKDYLRILLYLTPNKDKINRSMNMIEANIRLITGKDNFRLDNCIAGGMVQIIMESSYGYELLIKRSFSYY